MGLAYVGDLEMAEEAEAEQTPNSFGLTQIIRRFGGPRYQYEAFMSRMKDGDEDDEFPDLRLVVREISASFDGPFVHINLPFKGIRFGDLKPKRTQGKTEKTTVLTAPDGGRMTVTYFAPFATFRYATEKRPKAPRYAGQLLPFAGCGIIELIGDFDREVVEGELPSLGVSSNSLIPSNDVERFIFSTQVVQSVFDAEEQGEGGAWEVTETNEARIIDARRRFPQKFSVVQV